MAIHYKGYLARLEDLPSSDLPDHAVPYDEPADLDGLIKAIMPWHWPLLALIAAAYVIRSLLTGHWLHLPTLLGCLAIIPGFFLHEWVHAWSFPRGAEVHIYQKIDAGLLMAYSPQPVSRLRFIVISAAPGLLLGLLPLGIWALTASDHYLARSLLPFGCALLLGAVGDFYNIYNTLVQVPKGAHVQLSGWRSYWFR
ncbi:metalloprotease family protein [Peptococcus simiae]|uniref:metalloprotease family protein n=1 Tax=Peptococcus simiae TaxID=1643805 RepID=UPI0039808CB8